ncbi:protein-tyrosine phosphatase-like protein [Diplogelasinospora grovesii]|uniref:protein-tyrosine-phosphatase n=1 Tax=Diplogelasinospora grovesii TaxID=303347 RepID=A0AAN6MYV7_9PEZI|nr:protein-tyrosine phosphatase-like protein [Diplogelasinospora grovesii]
MGPLGAALVQEDRPRGPSPVHTFGPSDNSSVLLHCDKGVSRSPTALIAYLMRTHGWSFNTALAFVQVKRRIRPNENFKEQLQVWEAVKYEIWEHSEGRTPKAEYAAYLERRAKRLQERGLTGDEPIGLHSLLLNYTTPRFPRRVNV